MYCGYQRYFCHGLRIEPELYCVHCLLKSDCQNDVSTIFKNYNKQLCLQPFSNKFVSLLYSFVLSYNGQHMILDGVLDLASDQIRAATEEEKNLAKQFDIITDMVDFIDMDV